VLGSRCAVCGAPVCAGEACSLFYSKRFCGPCARAHAAAFPPELAACKVFAAAAPAPAAASGRGATGD
jgi:hypothetical protein